jgi:hypothetical protein
VPRRTPYRRRRERAHCGRTGCELYDKPILQAGAEVPIPGDEWFDHGKTPFRSEERHAHATQPDET